MTRRWVGVNQVNFEAIIHELKDGVYRRYTESEWNEQEDSRT